MKIDRNAELNYPQAQDQMADQDHSPAFWTSVASTFRGKQAVLFDVFSGR